MKTAEKPRIYIEALPLTTRRTSGIGYTLANIVRTLSTDEQVTSRYDLVLFGPKSGQQRIKQWGFVNTTYHSYPMKQRVVTALNLLGVLPPIDRLLGRGIYFFGNYVNYPVTNKSRSITYIHDVSYLRYPESVRPKVRRILKNYVPGWIKRTNHVLSLSEHAKTEIVHFYHVNPHKITVVPSGINPEEFYPRPDSEIEKVKQTYGIKGQYILFLSNIEPRKNLERLIAAYCLLPKALSDQYALLIVGGETWLDEPISRAITLAQQTGANIVRPSKYVEDIDLPALHSGATILVHPALYEGFGVAPLQAMACGIPVVVARASSLPEVVGDAGIYVDPLNVKDITQALEKLLVDPKLRSSLSQKGLKQAKKFTWQEAKARLMTVLEAQDF